MPHIKEVKKKSIWITRKIFAKLESLNLGKYYFQSAIIFLNLMLRSSILYACETFYNLKEKEIRELERIEEVFLRMMFKTTKGCPLAQLYLESGHIPARFAVKKSRLLKISFRRKNRQYDLGISKITIGKPNEGRLGLQLSEGLKRIGNKSFI